MDKLPTRQLLDSTDVDALTRVLHLLLGEVAVLAERVAILEDNDSTDSQTRITALTERVLAPLAADRSTMSVIPDRPTSRLSES